MVDKFEEFTQILQEHLHGLKSDISDPDTNVEMDQCNALESNTKDTEKEEMPEDRPETLTVDIPMTNDILNTGCLMLCGRILRIMGDEVTCRACGKSLRNIGDEIFCSYATRNILTSLLKDLSKTETAEKSIR